MACTFPMLAEIDNPGFEFVEPGCDELTTQGIYDFAFRDECLGDHWRCLTTSPDVRLNWAPFGPAYEGEHFAHMTFESHPNGLRESIYYQDFEMQCETPYDFSFAVKSGHGGITFQVWASSLIEDNCEEFPIEGWGTGIIESQYIHEDEGWVVFTAEDFMFPCNFFSSGSANFIIRPISIDADNIFQLGHLLVDDVSFVRSPCDPMICSEEMDLNACADEGDFGYILLECEGASSYEWDLPSTNAIELECGNSSVILNAGEGNYNVTVTGENGCIEERTYDITSACCDCPIPYGVTCDIRHGKVYLEWTVVPNATYTLTMIKNDFTNCGCGIGINETVILPDLTNNYIFLTPSQFECFSWSVTASCEGGLESESSNIMCFTGKGCNTEYQSNDQDKILLKPTAFPNPTNGALNLKLEAPGELEVIVEIFDVNGHLVQVLPNETNIDGIYSKNLQLDHEIKDGIYFVLFRTNYGSYQEKIIVTNDRIIDKE